MIDSLFNLIFHCRHRRMSFPFRPASKTGFAQGETYVICLDCAKQFTYDWEHMRVGKAIELAKSGRPRQRSRLRLLLWASAFPAVWLIGSVFKSGRKRRGDG
ncbi:MAG: hypothetical protein M1541_06530 [Acidobacteria bacterium]|nr:hypothetical protein [Acidobacteriota bacterium]